MRDNLVEFGLPETKLYGAMKKFEKIGGRTQQGRRNSWYQVLCRHGKMMVDRYHVSVDALVVLSGYVPSGRCRQCRPG